jgi:hypothetical protein
MHTGHEIPNLAWKHTIYGWQDIQDISTLDLGTVLGYDGDFSFFRFLYFVLRIRLE